jgi:hypothetical protein
VSEKKHERPLGFWSATGAVIATMIGAGIFGATGGFAHELGTDTNVLLVWLFCGLLALTRVCWTALWIATRNPLNPKQSARNRS